MRRGFSLIEVLVALVVLEVGILGVVGMLLSAQGIVREAVRIELGVTEAGRLLDSLAGSPGSGAGERATAAGMLSWSVTEGGEVRVRLPAEAEAPWLEVGTILPAGVPR